MAQEPQEQDQKEKAKHKVRAMPTMPDGVCVTKLRVTSATLVATVVQTTKRVTMYAQRVEARRARKEGKAK